MSRPPLPHIFSNSAIDTAVFVDAAVVLFLSDILFGVVGGRDVGFEGIVRGECVMDAESRDLDTRG